MNVYCTATGDIEATFVARLIALPFIVYKKGGNLLHYGRNWRGRIDAWTRTVELNLLRLKMKGGIVNLPEHIH